MRKHLKRTVSLLLAVVMVLTMLPTFASAAPTEAYTAVPVGNIPADGVAVVIFNALGSAVMGSEATGGKIAAESAKVNEEDTNIEVYRGAGVYKLYANSDGTYYLTCGGKYLTATGTNTCEFKASPEAASKWKVTKTDGGFFLQNNAKSHSSGPATIEFYGTAFNPWGFDGVTNVPNFTMSFYTINEVGADPDGDGYAGTKPLAGEKPADGDKIVIYNEHGGMAFGPQSDDLTAPSLTGIDSYLDETGTSFEPGNGALIFDVHFDGKYYTFENQGKFLRTSPNEVVDGKNSNAECLYFDTVESDYTKWTLEQITGGFVMYNKIAKYGSSSVCVEFFSGSFSGWTYNGSAGLFAMRFFKVEDPHGIGYVLNPKMYIDADSAFIGLDYSFEVTLDELTRVNSMSMTYSTDGGNAKALEPTAVDGYKYSYEIPSSALKNKDKLTLMGSATNEYGMTYTKEVTVDIKDEPIIASVSPSSNEATFEEKRPTITIELVNCGSNPTVAMSVDGAAVTPTVTDNKVTYKPAADMTDDRHTVSFTVTRSDGKKAEMVWSFYVGEAGLSLYFGQMHSHTAEYSDGAGTLEDAYAYGQKAQDVDYLIVTDHSNYFDTTATATTSSYYDLSSLSKSGSISKWEEAKLTALEYTTDDFIAAYGYEMTWSGGPGHTNSFNTYGTISRNNSALNNKTGYAGMHLYNDLMANADRGLDVDGNPVAEGVYTKYIQNAPVISQLNHPGPTFGNFDDFAGYTPTRDAVINLIEVGNGEGATGGSSYWPSYSQYDNCLAKGWHVAPTNNQDNHKGKWGDANTCRVVILTDNFTETGLYHAMSNRNVYATEDQNLRIYYYLNDHIMGSIIDTGDEEIKEAKIVASISDPDGEKLGKIQIIGENGLVLKTFDAPGSTYELNTTIENTDAYYYLKIVQADGNIAVTAPVWVGVATPIVADIDTDAALCVEGGTETITATVDNAADDDYTLKKVEFTLIIDGEETVIKTIEDTSVIAAGASKTFTFEYTRTEHGEQEIKVVFYGTYKDKAFKCQAIMKDKVYEADKLIKVAIDYGHGNFYVSGGYSDNMGNFIQYCADNGVMAEFIQQGEFTYDNLKQYKLVILTVPFDTGNMAPSAYSDSELSALKKYAKRGGNLIIATKSDRKSPEGELNCAALTNSLLEAVGSNVRAANGIIVDNDLKSNEAYRIYFSGKENFNSQHRFVAGAYTASNAFGTLPSPTNQTGFQLYNAAPILINEDAGDKVTTMVRGYQTTWGASYTDNFDGSAYIPQYSGDTVTAEMGDVNIMTYEELSGGGWLIVSGCTFFSNYDIKDDVDYANKFIVMNILREITNADDNLVISEISKVKAVPIDRSGEEYTIEGYITSNASGYDQDTAFFDCIYMQDKKGNGINCFPVAGNYAIGMNVRAHGGVTYYCGEVELNLSTDYEGYIRVISDDVYVIQPEEVDCATAMSDEAIGNLMKVKGIITSIHKTEGVIDKIYVRDAAGEACLFINGYIMKDYRGLDDLKVGMIISGVGIGSRDVDETSATSAIFSRLRVRDRREIKVIDGIVNGDLVFDDVKEDDWFYDAVMFAAERSLLTGVSHSIFAPDATLTRAMVATVLHRMAGEPAATSSADYEDVESGMWYSDAVEWASEVGIVRGYEDNTFRPDNKITRQEMAVMLARYAELVCGIEMENRGTLNVYADGSQVADWAHDSVVWFVNVGIINGMDGKIAPNHTATRAQFAAIIMRFVQLYQP